MLYERNVSQSTTLIISLLMAVFDAVACMNEDSDRAGDSAEQLSSLILSNTFLQPTVAFVLLCFLRTCLGIWVWQVEECG